MAQDRTCAGTGFAQYRKRWKPLYFLTFFHLHKMAHVKRKVMYMCAHTRKEADRNVKSPVPAVPHVRAFAQFAGVFETRVCEKIKTINNVILGTYIHN
jgi:hypothetical protein